MPFSRISRIDNWDGYSLGDPVRFKDSQGEWRRGVIHGRGAAGFYLQIEDEHGHLHEGYAGQDVHPVFSDDEDD